MRSFHSRCQTVLGKKVDGKPLPLKLLSSICSFLRKTGSIRTRRLADVLVQRGIRKCGKVGRGWPDRAFSRSIPMNSSSSDIISLYQGSKACAIVNWARMLGSSITRVRRRASFVDSLVGYSDHWLTSTQVFRTGIANLATRPCENGAGWFKFLPKSAVKISAGPPID